MANVMKQLCQESKTKGSNFTSCLSPSQITFAYFIKSSMTVQLVSSLTGLDSVALLQTNGNKVSRLV